MNSNAETQISQETPTVYQIVEHFLGEVDWRNGEGYCKCPGDHLHTHKSGKRDCKVYVSGKIPWATCFHDHCYDVVKETNRQILEVWNLYAPELPPEEVAAMKEKSAKKKMLIDTAKNLKPQILDTYKWSLDQMKLEINFKEDSETALRADWQQHLKLFSPEDILWMGEPDSTGKSIHAAHWRRQLEWGYMPGPVGNFTSASVFKRGIWSRSNNNVVSRPYLVIECDDVLGNGCPDDAAKAANKDACGAIFRWMRDSLGLELKQVIDTGNKSLHGWFVMPSADVFEELKIVLPELGADRATFKPSQPVRVPGVYRHFDNGTSKAQRIVWRASK